MKRRRHTPEQVIRKLAEADKLLAEGKTVEEACRHLEITESTYHRWRSQFGGMKANDAKRLKELEHENARLKKLLAEAELERFAHGCEPSPSNVRDGAGDAPHPWPGRRAGA
jgi:putative transposase